MKNCVSFIEGLLQLVPEMTVIYDDHLKDNGALLPHVLMGNITRFAVAESNTSRKSAVLLRLLGHFENGLNQGESEVRELILASFVENLIGETTALKVLVPLMGSNLRREVEAICGNDTDETVPRDPERGY